MEIFSEEYKKEIQQELDTWFGALKIGGDENA